MARTPQPLVSVILSTHNSAPFLRETLQSILNQEYRNLEIVAVDDASTDNTWQMLQSIRDPRLRLYRNRTNRGISRTRNRGLQLARGKHIAFFDHDDIMLPNAIRKRVECLEKEKTANVAFGFDKAVIDEEGKVLKRAPSAWSAQDRASVLNYCRLARTVDLKQLRAFTPIHFPMLTHLLVRKALVRKAGCLDPSFKTAEDCEYVRRLGELTPFHFVDIPVKMYRLHGGNMTLVTSPRELRRNAMRVIARYPPGADLKRRRFADNG